MKYCPYCGAALVDSIASFCAECGKTLPVREEKKPSESVMHQKEKSKPPKQKVPNPTKKKKASSKGKIAPDMGCSTSVNDGYDGYYDDIFPTDGGNPKEGMDVELIKKIVSVIGVVLLIVGLCVVALYLL